MEKIQLNVSENANEIIIREGTLLDPLRDNKVNISANISAPRKFAEVRIPDKIKCHVLFCKEGKKIKYIEDEKNPLGSEITGSLITNPGLSNFGINHQKTRSPK